jgi:hypothetical protein
MKQEPNYYHEQTSWPRHCDEPFRQFKFQSVVKNEGRELEGEKVPTWNENWYATLSPRRSVTVTVTWRCLTSWKRNCFQRRNARTSRVVSFSVSGTSVWPPPSPAGY